MTNNPFPQYQPPSRDNRFGAEPAGADDATRARPRAGGPASDPRLDPQTGQPWPTDRCMVTVGFYVLGRCGSRADSVCPRCGRGMCGLHSMRTPAGELCLTCETEERNFLPDSGLDPNWAARCRRRYRENAGQRFNDRRVFWSFNTYDTYYSGPGMGADIDDDFDNDYDMFDS